jgi:formate hydrogenlyase subunit 6/NADH:ubiquinone oxidoreductase subunit I
MAGCRACGRVCRKDIPWEEDEEKYNREGKKSKGHHFNFIPCVIV